MEKTRENRDQQIKVRYTKSEYSRLRADMEKAGVSNMAAYIRKMSLDGYVLNLEVEGVKEMIRLLGRYGNNLNQTARTANAVGVITDSDVKEIRKQLDDIWDGIKKIMEWMSILE